MFRPSTGQWFSTGSPTVEFGINNDVPVPGDYNGNGPTDIAVWRPSEGNWYLRNIATIPWGISGDIPVPADYNGDGSTDVAVWRPSQGVWYVRNVINMQWGSAGDIPVPADYTGDGKADIAIFRPSTGYWFIITVDQQQALTIPWGGMNDIPIPADYDGDGKADIAVFRGSEGLWYIRNVGAIPWGRPATFRLPKRPTYPGYPYLKGKREKGRHPKRLVRSRRDAMSTEQSGGPNVVRLLLLRHGERKRLRGEKAPLTAGGRWRAWLTGPWKPEAILHSRWRHAREHAGSRRRWFPRRGSAAARHGPDP